MPQRYSLKEWGVSRHGWAIHYQAELSPREKMKFLNRRTCGAPGHCRPGLSWHVANAQEQGQAGKTSYMKGTYRIIRVDHGKNDSGKARD